MNVRITQEQKIKILNSEDIFKVMQQVLLRENKIRRNQEHFWVIGLNNANKILFIELIGLGAVNRVSTDPPDVFRMAIYKLAVKIILAHNHPSLFVEPSKADIDFTDRMFKVGKLINIEVLDHLIISDNTYFSFGDEGIMHKIVNSGLYEIVEREKTELANIRKEMEKLNAIEERNIEIARKMKNDGIDIDTIQKYTSLKKVEIKKL